MGNFYVNFTVKGPDQQAVADALVGRTALITPQKNGCVVVFDKYADEQDTDVISNLAKRLSRKLSCPVLALLNHDDDILWYELYDGGELADEYNSAPDYLESGAVSAPAGGNAPVLCDAFGSSNVAKVQKILRAAYTFQVSRHQDLADALGIPSFAVGTGYTYATEGELPDGLSPDDLITP